LSCSDKADNRTTDIVEGKCLLQRLDGLPLAIAQAGAYLQESGVGIKTYLKFYEQQWSGLMGSQHMANAPLTDYPDRSVWTTWAISYQAIRNKHEATANLLLLWSFLDNKDLWYGLFAAACASSRVATRMLLGWIGNIASSELEFTRAMQLLRNFSLIEVVEGTKSYATHPVVHQWAHSSQGKGFAIELSQLAVVTVGWSVPHTSTRNYATLQRRLLLHAQAYSRQRIKSKASRCLRDDKYKDEDLEKVEERNAVLGAIHQLGNLYADQGKLGEAEQMYKRALQGKEEALGPTHTSTLYTVNNLGLLYADQGKLGEAEQMFKRALRGYEVALGKDGVQQYLPALNNLQNMGDLYTNQGEIAKAQAMYAKALYGLRLVLGQSSDRCICLAAKVDASPTPQTERGKRQKLPALGDGPELRHNGRKKGFRLSVRKLAKQVF
jgi:tetratricopeptide (TPR) repeat protein